MDRWARLVRGEIGVPRRMVTWFAFATAVTISASSGAPTPLFRIYQERMSLSPFLITIIFAIYVVGLLAALLTVGRLSDFVGRRPVIAAAMLLNGIAMLVFINANGPHWLILARLLQGIATGAATATLGATMLDTEPQRGPLINSVTPFIGLMIGTLGAGLLATHAPAPTQLSYVVLLILSLAEAAATAVLPETTQRRPGALASMRPRFAVPGSARPMFLILAPGNIAAWGLGGFYLSLMPSVARATMGITSPMVGGMIVSTLMGTAAVVVLLLRNTAAPTIRLFGAGALAIGILVALDGISTRSFPTLMIGTLIGGAGFGASFTGVLRSLFPLAAPGDRAGLLSSYYVQSYLAFALPAICAGLAAPRFGIVATAVVYGAVLLALVSISLIGMVVVQLRSREPSAALPSVGHRSQIVDREPKVV